MKILATGITGRMGPSVATALAGRHEITAMGRRKSDHLPFDYFQGNVTVLDDVMKACEGKDMILHMAARSNADAGDDDVVFASNLSGMFNILEAARRNGIKKVVYSSSGRAFGVGFADPYTPPDYVPVDEEHPSRPRDTYGISKVMTEELCKVYAKNFGMTIISLRFTWVVNVEDFSLLQKFLHNPGARAFGMWSWIDERDAADSILLAIENSSLKGFHNFIITGDDTAVAEDSAELLRRYYPGVTEFRTAISGRMSLLSNQKAKRLLGFAPRYTLEESPLADALAEVRKSLAV